MRRGKRGEESWWERPSRKLVELQGTEICLKADPIKKTVLQVQCAVV